MTMGGGITAIVALTMGLRHGLDADHLSVVDALARQRAASRCASPAATGVLFALGHVAVILVVAVALFASSRSFDPPSWLATVGGLVSSMTLLLLGVLNVRAALCRPIDGAPRVVGVRARWMNAAEGSRSPLCVLGIGALFAASFDAVALAGLFAGTAHRLSAAILATGLFAVGMVAVSAINGLWVARVLRDLAGAHRGAARTLALTIGVTSLVVGGWILLGLVGQSGAVPISDIGLSLFVVAAMVLGYGAAFLLAR